MNKETIADRLTQQYNSFTGFVQSMVEEQYNLAPSGKWTAGQHLAHLVLCVKPLVQVYGMPAAALAQTFGQTNRGSRSYDELKETYLQLLGEGGKAPSRFVPELSPYSQRRELCDTLSGLIVKLNEETALFSDDELDTLQVPHPLLGNLTLREMLYNAIYHAEHHRLKAALPV